MKKLIWLVMFLFFAVGLTACSTLKRNDVKANPGELQVVLVNTIDSKTPRTTKSKTQFNYGDMVYAYMTLGWDQNIQAKKIDVKWRNAAGFVMAEQDRFPRYARDPHHVWFWVNSAQLGKGTVSAEIFLDEQSVKVVSFDVVDPLRYEHKESWYNRIFKKNSTPKEENNPNQVQAPDDGSSEVEMATE